MHEILARIAPDEWGVELGLSAKYSQAKLVALLWKGEATASIKLSLKWKKENGA